MIQQALRATVGGSKVAVNVNADEAAVLGAGLHGAGLSRQFKTKDIKVSDVYMYDIQASYPTEPKEGAPSKTITSTIFPPGSKKGSRKTLTFRRKNDFSIKLLYKRTPFVCVPTIRVIHCLLVDRFLPSSDHPQGIVEVKIGSVAEAIANLTEKGVVEPVVKATITLSESGFVSISDAIAVGELKQDSIKGEEWIEFIQNLRLIWFADKIKGLFGGSSGDLPSSIPTGTDSELAVLADESTTPEDPLKLPGLEATIPLTIDFEFGPMPPMTAAEKRVARDRFNPSTAPVSTSLY